MAEVLVDKPGDLSLILGTHGKVERELTPHVLWHMLTHIDKKVNFKTLEGWKPAAAVSCRHFLVVCHRVIFTFTYLEISHLRDPDYYSSTILNVLSVVTLLGRI